MSKNERGMMKIIVSQNGIRIVDAMVDEINSMLNQDRDDERDE